MHVCVPHAGSATEHKEHAGCPGMDCRQLLAPRGHWVLNLGLLEEPALSHSAISPASSILQFSNILHCLKVSSNKILLPNVALLTFSFIQFKTHCHTGRGHTWEAYCTEQVTPGSWEVDAWLGLLFHSNLQRLPEKDPHVPAGDLPAIPK